MAEKSWQWEPEVAGLFASTDKKPREMNAGSQLAFSFIFILEPQPTGWSRPQWARLSTSISLIWVTPQRHAQRFISKVILNLT